jgi:hypothetical protein
VALADDERTAGPSARRPPAENGTGTRYGPDAVTADGAVTAEPGQAQEEFREEIDNPIERLKLLSESDAEIAAYLDALEVTSPREREMLYEISRTRPLAQPDRFPQAHRNMVEALESLARHGTRAGAHAGPLRWFVRWSVSLVGRYLVASQIRTLSTRLRNLPPSGDRGGPGHSGTP